MKIRTGFVSNSSSSSFLIIGKNNGKTKEEIIKDIKQNVWYFEECQTDCDDIRQYILDLIEKEFNKGNKVMFLESECLGSDFFNVCNEFGIKVINLEDINLD